jgi:hypothetical protein
MDVHTSIPILLTYLVALVFSGFTGYYLWEAEWEMAARSFVVMQVYLKLVLLITKSPGFFSAVGVFAGFVFYWAW